MKIYSYICINKKIKDMKTFFKDSKIVRFASDQPSKITQSMTTSKLFYSNTLEMSEKHVTFEGAKYQYLYFLSDDEIKEGEYYINVIQLREGYLKVHKYNEIKYGKYKCHKKIIATNDPNLISDGVAEIPETFLISYCENPDENILVEYEKLYKGISLYSSNLFHPFQDELWREESKGLLPNSIYLQNVKNPNITNCSRNGFVIGEDIEEIDSIKRTSDNKITVVPFKPNKIWYKDEVRELFSKLQWDMAQQIIGNRGVERIVPLEWFDQQMYNKNNY